MCICGMLLNRRHWLTMTMASAAALEVAPISRTLFK